MITTETIQGLAFFDGITEEQAKAIAEIAVITHYQAGDVVQYEGEDIEAFYFVQSGLVALEINMEHDKNVTIDTIKPGELFGWSAFVPPHKVTAKSVCQEHVQLIQIPQQPFFTLLQNDLQLRSLVYERTLHIVSDRLRDTRSQLNYLLAWN